MSENAEQDSRQGGFYTWDRSLSGHGPATQLMLRLAARMHVGSCVLELSDGSIHSFGGREPGPRGILRVHRDRLARRLITGGNIGFGEAYLDGDFDSPDLAEFLTMAALNRDALEKTLRGRWWFRLFQTLGHRLNRNSRAGSRRNIAHHYDLGNDFYAAWLDPSMTYSSAEFTRPGMTLAEAQEEKYRNLANRLAVPDGGHVLEIGCGWGGFAEYLARTRDVKLTCLTISREQHDYAARRIQMAGLGERVEIRLQDYRDVTGRYDGIASIEMFEAVGREYWPRYFQVLRERLKGDAKAALQIITIADHAFEGYARRPDFIQRYIFPGGMLPSPALLDQEFKNAGLRKVAEECFGQSYAQTLAEWNRRFQSAWPALRQAGGFDLRFRRMWEYYLAYCEAGFRAGQLDVLRVSLTREGA